MGLAITRRLGSGQTVLLADFNNATLTTTGDTLRGEGHDVSNHPAPPPTPRTTIDLHE
jgi:hypothetical protein